MFHICNLFLLFLFFSVLSHADSNKAIWKLLHSKRRPTMSQLREVLTPWPDKNPLNDVPLEIIEKLSKTLKNTDSFKDKIAQVQKTIESLSEILGELDLESDFFKLVEKDGAVMIAVMERIYPNATWAGLGRDVSTLMDVLEGFYLSHGYADRVRRIDASRETIDTANERQLVRLLTSNGWNATNPKQSRPFILVDRTAFGDSSQTTQLIRAAYTHYANTGANAADLLAKLNALSTSHGENGTGSVDRLRRFFGDQLNSIQANGCPNELVIVKEASSFTDRNTWHDSFGPMVGRADKTWGGKIGEPESIATRFGILWEMYEIWNIVSKSAFLDRVQDTAKQQLGYTFSFQNRKFLLKPKRISVGSKAWIKSLPQVDEDEQNLHHPIFEYFTEEILAWKTNSYVFEEFCQLLVFAVEKKRVSSEEVKKIFLHLLKDEHYYSDKFYEAYLAVFHESAALRTYYPEAERLHTAYRTLTDSNIKCRLLIAEQ